MTFIAPRGFVQTVTCSFCSQKTQGHRTARNTIVCHWCGKLFEDKEQGVDLYPDLERQPKYGWKKDKVEA